MRKRLLAMAVALAVFMVSGPMEIFALENGPEGTAAPAAEAVAVTDEADEALPEEDAAEETETLIEEEQVLSEEAYDAGSQNLTATLTVNKPTDITAKTAKVTWTCKITTASGAAYKGSDVKYRVTINGKTTGELTEKSYEASGLSKGTEYSFTVEAYDSQGTLATAESKTFKTKLSNVKKFKVVPGYEKVKLTWKKVSGADGYKITWKKKGKKKTLGTKVISKGSETSAIIPVDTDVKYTFYIQATKDNGAKSAKKTKVSGEAVRTIHYKFELKRDRVLTSHSGGKVKARFKKGTTITAYGFKQGKYVFKYKGRIYYVLRISTYNARVSQIKSKDLYDKKTAEFFVNSKKLSSGTNYLIWVNTYTQREYIFKGSRGNWKLIKGPWMIASGKANTPTDSGMTSIRTKSANEHGVLYWSMCAVFSLHGKVGNIPFGYPRSSACVRNTNEHARYIYNTCKRGTGVYIY